MFDGALVGMNADTDMGGLELGIANASARKLADSLGADC